MFGGDGWVGSCPDSVDVPYDTLATGVAPVSVSANGSLQQMSMELKTKREKAFMSVLERIRQAGKNKRCAICFALIDPLLRLPKVDFDSLGNHFVPSKCTLNALDARYSTIYEEARYKSDIQKPMTTALRNAGLKDKGYCWMCFLPNDDEHHRTPSKGTNKCCVYNDIVGRLVYCLLQIAPLRDTLFHKVDPKLNMQRMFTDAETFNTWLFKHTDGNYLYNFQELIYQFGLYRRIVFAESGL